MGVLGDWIGSSILRSIQDSQYQGLLAKMMQPGEQQLGANDQVNITPRIPPPLLLASGQSAPNPDNPTTRAASGAYSTMGPLPTPTPAPLAKAIEQGYGPALRSMPGAQGLALLNSNIMQHVDPLEQQKVEAGQIGLDALKARTAALQGLIAPQPTAQPLMAVPSPQGPTPSGGVTPPAPGQGAPMTQPQADPIATYFPKGTPPNVLTSARLFAQMGDSESFNKIVADANKSAGVREGESQTVGGVPIYTAPKTAAPTPNTPQSPLGKLAADLHAGNITPDQFKAAYEKETRLPPGPQPTDMSFLAPIIEKVQKGTPLTAADNTILSVLKPNANVGAGPGSTPPGLTGKPDIDIASPGYTIHTVGNTGLTQAAIDQKALGYITNGTNPPQGRTGLSGFQNAAISNRMAEMDPGGNLGTHKAQVKAFAESLTTQQKNLDNTQAAFNTANDTLDALQEWMVKTGVNPSQFPDMNRLNNFLKAKGIDPGAAGGYNAQLTTLRQEFSQVLAKGGVRSVETDKEAATLIPDGLAPADLAKVAERIRVDSENVVRDRQNQVAQITEQINKIRTGNASPGYQPPPTGGALPSGVTEEDIQHTLKLHPETTREQLLQKLGGK